MQCPSCKAKVKDDAKLCVKCGESLVEARQAQEAEARQTETPTKPSPLQKLHYLKELAPKRAHVSQLLPHPTGWVLGIGVPAIALLALIHLAVMPSRAQAEANTVTINFKVTPEQKTEFQICLATTRAKANKNCGQITGTAQGLRRVSCQATSRAAGYTKCSGAMIGRLGSCLKRCGQAARTCSSACAIIGAKSWTETAKCLIPCWKVHLDACITTCF